MYHNERMDPIQMLSADLINTKNSEEGFYMFNDTIAAISTPLAAGAVSIIRLSGDEAISIANKIFSRDLQKQTSHTIAHGFIQEDGTQ